MSKELYSLALPEDWPVCELCEERIRPDRRCIEHHFNYDPPVTSRLCHACHTWLHGQGKVFNHPFKRIFDTDDERKAFAPIVFAYRLIELFEQKMSVKTIVLAVPQIVNAGYPSTFPINPKQGQRKDN